MKFIKVDIDEKHCVLTIFGELTVMHVHELKETLSKLLETTEIAALNLEHLTMAEVECIHTIFNADKDFQQLTERIITSDIYPDLVNLMLKGLSKQHKAGRSQSS